MKTRPGPFSGLGVMAVAPAVALTMGVTLGACADAHEVAPVVDAGGPPAPPSDACAGEALDWSSSMPEGVYGHVTLRTSDDGALLLRTGAYGIGGAQLVRTRDGEVLAAVLPATLSPSFRRAASADEVSALTVVDLATGEIVASASAPSAPSADEGWYPRTLLTFAPDGATLFALDCWSRPATEEATAHARALDVATGDVTTVALGVACDPTWQPDPILLPSDPRISPALGDVLHVVGLADAVIARVRFGDGTVATRAMGSDVTPIAPVIGSADIGPPETDFLSASLSTRGDALAVTRNDGTAHVLDATTLEPRFEPIETGVVVANGDTYLPTRESPVALSGDAARLAFVGRDGRAAIMTLATGAVERTFDGPLSPADIPFARDPNAPTAFLFDDDAALFASYEGGVARFACALIERPPTGGGGALEVTLDGPTSARLGDIATFDISVRGTDAPTVRWLELDGVSLGVAELERPHIQTYVTGTAGPHTLRLVADDGVRRGVSREHVITYVH